MLKHIRQEIWSLLMKIITTVHQILFFKTTDLYILDTKIWKNILSSYESKNLTWELRMRNEIFILLEIILNAFNVWQYLFTLKSKISYSATLFTSVNILCEFAMLPDVYILSSPQEEEVHSSSGGDRCMQLVAHSSKRLNPLSLSLY